MKQYLRIALENNKIGINCNDVPMEILIVIAQYGCLITEGRLLFTNVSTSEFEIYLKKITLDPRGGMSLRDQTYFINLKYPILLGNNSNNNNDDNDINKEKNFPFQIKFDMEMKYIKWNRGVGRHGGVYFGFDLRGEKRGFEKVTRDAGHCSIDKGAKCTVIDWIDRVEDHGFRIYGTNEKDMLWKDGKYKDKDYQDGQWIIKFENEKICKFLFDGDLVHTFEPVACTGGIGFWCWKGCKIIVSNLIVEKL